MRIFAKDPATAGLALAALLTLGCGDSTAPPAVPPPMGIIEVTVTTTSTGGEIDPNGYILSLDMEDMRLIASNGKLTFGGVPAGVHHLFLYDIAGNCSVSGGNSIAVEIPQQQSISRVPISFVVLCAEVPPPGPSPWDY